MPKGPGEKGLADTRGTDDQKVFVGTDPFTSGELLKQGVVQAPGSPVVDVLETGGLANPAFGQTSDKLLVLPLEELPVGQKPEPLLEGEVPGHGGVDQFPKALGHDRETEAMELVDRGMGQHGGFPFVLSRAA